MAGVLVYAEQKDGTLKKPALEALGEGVRLAGALGVPCIAAVAGPGCGDAAAAVASHGASKVLTMDHEALGTFTAAGYGRAVAAAAKSVEADIVLMAASAQGKDLAPAVAARLDASPVVDCTATKVDGGAVHWVRPVYAGKAYATVAVEGTTAVASLRPNAFEPAGESGEAGAVEAFDPGVQPSDLGTVLKEVLAPAARRIDLTEADVVVAGGRGLKAPEHFNMVEELAAALGGVVGASRAVVDAGWRPHSEQVGQTGKTVAPKLYVALGISGAIQHLAGMSSSRCIVAINKDAEAPIFKVADYGIVGDVFEVAPALTKAVLELKGG
ncbi:MAG: electron transfer flavoprotein subunit alpha/FixB family protein [Planctomycetota bacterium]|jgi:electron transfer flavoprotein alpha subunit